MAAAQTELVKRAGRRGDGGVERAGEGGNRAWYQEQRKGQELGGRSVREDDRESMRLVREKGKGSCGADDDR